jgi:hypothetical protein
MRDNEQYARYELTKQVVVNVAAGLAVYMGPGASALAAGAAPVVLAAAFDYISSTVGSRRLDHATETLTDAADEFGATATGAARTSTVRVTP